VTDIHMVSGRVVIHLHTRELLSNHRKIDPVLVAEVHGESRIKEVVFIGELELEWFSRRLWTEGDRERETGIRTRDFNLGKVAL
jgi:hypothetical protein